MGNLQLLSAVTAVNGAPTAVAASGSITTVAVASIVNGESFSLYDGIDGNLKFVFDTLGTFAEGVVGRHQVAISLVGLTTAAQVRDAIIAAINAASIAITASSGGAATVTLTNDYPGAQGNQPAQENVANATFAVAGMSGGALGGVALAGLRRGVAASGNADVQLVLRSTAGSSMEVTARLWVYSTTVGVWAPFGLGDDGSKGQLNDGHAIGETTAGQISHSQVIPSLQGFERAYLEIEALAGVSTAISAWLISLAS